MSHRILPSVVFLSSIVFTVSTQLSAQTSCIEDTQSLCLSEERFEVTVEWRDFADQVGSGNVVPGSTNDSGTFWFFEAANWEVVTKVLDGCDINDRYWVFVAPMTNVEYRLRIHDTQNDRTRSWFNPLGRQGATVVDTQAFPCSEVTTNVPLLPPGIHHGYQTTFESLPGPTAALVEQLHDEAREAGMRVSRAGADWAELEPEPGIYDRAALEDSLEEASAQGLLPFVWIPAVDSEGLVLPADLRDPEDLDKLRNGLTLASPEVVERYLALLDWAVPMIVQHGGWVLAVGNEPDGYLEDHAREGSAPLANFVAAARQRVQSLAPQLATTITLTGGSILEQRPFTTALVDASDIVSVNYYCLNADLTFRGPLEQTVAADLDALLVGSRGKELVFQELGCPSGWTDRPSVIGVDEADSVEFFRTIYPLLAAEPRVRATFVFQLVDWSETLVDLVYGDLRNVPLPEGFVDRLYEWLETTGLITFDGERIKVSWEEFLAALPGRPAETVAP